MYTTIDYPNNQFIFITKDQESLIESHKNKYIGDTMDFVMWGDHYMMGKGKYNGKNVNMFFDSGLVVVGQIGNKILQSWMCMTIDSMNNLGIIEKDSTSTTKITVTNDIIQFAGITRDNVLLSRSTTKPFEFGGVKCDLLISHGLIKDYAWSIDFKNMTYTFSK